MFTPLSAISWCSKSSSVLRLAGNKSRELQVLLQNTFCCKYMCQEAGFTWGTALSPSPICHSTFTFCLILSRGCTRRCGERFCWLAHWTACPLSTSLHPHTHNTQTPAFWAFSATFRRLTKSPNSCNWSKTASVCTDASKMTKYTL